MLTTEQMQLLKRIHAGDQATDDHQAHILLERGFLARQPGGLGITPAGRRALGLAEGFGDAILDAVLPGEGSRQAEKDR